MQQRGKWFCAQMGAREHYAIPRALNKTGALGGLLTDFWAGPATQSLARATSGKLTRSLATRFHQDLPVGVVTSWNLRALAWELRLRRMSRGGSSVERYLGYCEVGKRFSTAVFRKLARLNLSDGNVFFGYDTCSLEVMRGLKSQGVFCILDQIDPCRVEIEMVRAEQQAWPGWQSYDLDVPDEFYERHKDEWEIADKVVVNSQFSRDALVNQGLSAEKAVVIPLSYEPPEMSEQEKNSMMVFWSGLSAGFTQKKPLRVLFLGQVMLRKGIQYLVEAAELVRDYPIQFHVVGPLSISVQAVASAPPNMAFHGRATRNELSGWYRSAHVFILPTLSDGFAITQIEAMANGLPVITTPNCGAVVTDDQDGCIVPARNPKAIAAALNMYLDDPECLLRHHFGALEKSKQFSLKQLSCSLLALEGVTAV